MSTEAILPALTLNFFFINATTLAWLIEDSQPEVLLMVYSLQSGLFWILSCSHTFWLSDKATLPSEFWRENVLFAYQHSFSRAPTTNMQNKNNISQENLRSLQFFPFSMHKHFNICFSLVCNKYTIFIGYQIWTSHEHTIFIRSLYKAMVQ